MEVVHLLVAAMATWQIVEIWHHSSVMAGWRARIELYDSGFRGWLAELTACPYCLSIWVGWICTLVLFIPYIGVLIWGLAASRLANLGNDFFKSHSQTPKHNKIELGSSRLEKGEEREENELLE